MSTKFYFKETVWREVIVDLTEDQRSEIYGLISDNKIQNCDDLYDHFFDKKIEPIDNRFDYNTSEPITKGENGGQPTIEVYERKSTISIAPDFTN